MSPSSSVGREPLAPTLVFIPARAPPTSFASGPSMSASTATESGAGVGCHVRVTKSPRDVPASSMPAGSLPRPWKELAGGGVDGIGTATAPPLERVGCSSWERVGVNTAEAPTPVDGAGDPGADPEPAP